MEQESKQDLSSKLRSMLDSEEARLSKNQWHFPTYSSLYVVYLLRWVLEELENEVA